MDKLDLELSGLDNVADVLRNTTFNTYGSFRERSGTSFGQVALVSLRGLGADYTAVLINGRRVPGNPITGGSSVDLNSIP
ncbi:MAG: TonB-dependent receptor plug domain-containing protein, partial [Pseudomonadota bacterium]